MTAATETPPREPAAIAGAGLPLADLSELARWVEGAEAARAEGPAASEAIEAALSAMRTAWPALGPDARRLLGALVTALVARRPPPAAVPVQPAGEPLAAALERLGVRGLRPGQDRAMGAALAGRDALVVMATGSGKSLCYQAPALVLSGLTLVVSPLIALMADQLAGLERAGVPAAALNSELGERGQRDALERAARGELRMLYVAPERFGSAAFRRALAGVPIALLVIDEAHCASEWGHEFRPDYRRLGAVRRELAPRATMALTATATVSVRADIARRLGLEAPLEVIGGFDRPNIAFDAAWVEGKGSLARKRAAVLQALGAAGGGKAIVYCGTRKAAEETAEALGREGYAAVPYHAGRSDRAEAQAAFAAGRVQVVTATNAFGMGIDVPDVRLVAHLTLPDSLEQLSQEAGRAGRDGEPAHHLVVAGPGDEVTARRRIAPARISPGEVEALLARLRARADADGGFALEHGDLGDDDHVRLAMAERVGAAELEAGRRGRLVGAGLTPEQREELEGLVRAEVRRRHRSLDQAVAYVRGDACRRAAFLTHFGDPADPAPEGRCCDRCDPPAEGLAPAAATPAARSPASRAAADPLEGLSAAERVVYEALRAWRGAAARELGWPAFRVASNRTLAGVARAAPADEPALAAVHGVGPWLMEAHSASILAVVAAASSGR